MSLFGISWRNSSGVKSMWYFLIHGSLIPDRASSSTTGQILHGITVGQNDGIGKALVVRNKVHEVWHVHFSGFINVNEEDNPVAVCSTVMPDHYSCSRPWGNWSLNRSLWWCEGWLWCHRWGFSRSCRLQWCPLGPCWSPLLFGMFSYWSGEVLCLDANGHGRLFRRSLLSHKAFRDLLQMDGLAVPGVPVNDVQVMVVHGNFLRISTEGVGSSSGRPWLSNLFLSSTASRNPSEEDFRPKNFVKVLNSFWEFSSTTLSKNLNFSTISLCPMRAVMCSVNISPVIGSSVVIGSPFLNMPLRIGKRNSSMLTNLLWWREGMWASSPHNLVDHLEV